MNLSTPDSLLFAFGMPGAPEIVIILLFVFVPLALAIVALAFLVAYLRKQRKKDKEG